MGFGLGIAPLLKRNLLSPLKRRAFLRLLRKVLQPNNTAVIIGANDGKSFDDCFQTIADSPVRLLCIEPIPQYLDELRDFLANRPETVFVEKALSNFTGTTTLQYVDTSSGLYNLPEWAKGIGSINPEKTVLSGKGIDAATAETIQAATQSLEISVMSVIDFLEEFKISKIDYLQVDTEGHDAVILEEFSKTTVRPSLIKYEHVNLIRKEVQTLDEIWSELNYLKLRGTENTLLLRRN
jgi:FkbM family methyltransferase